MRVPLPPPQPPTPTPMPTPGGSALPGSSPSGPDGPSRSPLTKPRLNTERLTRLLTAWALVLPLTFLCSSLLTWSIGVRLLDKKRVLAVHARSLKPIEITDPPVSAAELEALREEAGRVVAALPERPQEIGPLLAEL